MMESRIRRLIYRHRHHLIDLLFILMIIGLILLVACIFTVLIPMGVDGIIESTIFWLTIDSSFPFIKVTHVLIFVLLVMIYKLNTKSHMTVRARMWSGAELDRMCVEGTCFVRRLKRYFEEIYK